MPGYIADCLYCSGSEVAPHEPHCRYYQGEVLQMNKVIEKVYVEAVIICPHCKAGMNVLPPVKDMAVPAGSEFVCAACDTVSEIYLVAPEPRSLTKRAADVEYWKCQYCGECNHDDNQSCYNCSSPRR